MGPPNEGIRAPSAATAGTAERLRKAERHHAPAPEESGRPIIALRQPLAQALLKGEIGDQQGMTCMQFLDGIEGTEVTEPQAVAHAETVNE